MLERLKSLLNPGEPANARGPEDTALYAVGDVHGRMDLLDELIGRIEADAGKRAVSRRVLVFLGDYVDRGPDSAGVIERLSTLALPDFEVFCLSGNHEDMMLGFLESPANGRLWLQGGGGSTLDSYGVPAGGGRIDLPRLRDDLAARLPHHHRRFLRDLGTMRVEGDYCFVHAGIRPGTPLDRQNPQDILWIRDTFLKATRPHGKVVVHGHSVTYEADMFPDPRRPVRIGIDTGAFKTGRLTCLSIEGAERRFLQTGAA